MKDADCSHLSPAFSVPTFQMKFQLRCVLARRLCACSARHFVHVLHSWRFFYNASACSSSGMMADDCVLTLVGKEMKPS